MTPNGKIRRECEREWCPNWVKGKTSSEQTCVWFSEGYGGDTCFIKVLASRASREPVIVVPSIDLKDWKEEQSETSNNGENTPIDFRSVTGSHMAWKYRDRDCE